jgi:hypothetical protein
MNNRKLALNKIMNHKLLYKKLRVNNMISKIMFRILYIKPRLNLRECKLLIK